MTRQESYAIATILSLLLLGTVVKSIQKNTFLFDSTIYAEADSVFAAATQEINKKLTHQDSVHVNQNQLSQADSTALLKQILIAGGKIDINTASKTQLEELPRIGPAIAQRIIDYRQTMGPFKRIEDITAVKGIGPKTFDQISPQITTNPTHR